MGLGEISASGSSNSTESPSGVPLSRSQKVLSNVHVRASRAAAKTAKHTKRGWAKISNTCFWRNRLYAFTLIWIPTVLIVSPLLGMVFDTIVYGKVEGSHSTGWFFIGLTSCMCTIVHISVQHLFKGRLRTIWEILFHVIFYAFLCSYIETRASSSTIANHLNTWIEYRYSIDGDNYQRIRDFYSLWFYLQNDFVAGLNGTSATHFGSAALGFNEGHFIMGESTRIRQLRVRPNTCTRIWKMSRETFGNRASCYGHYSVENEDTSDFTDGGGNVWTWNDVKVQTVSGEKRRSSSYKIGPGYTAYHDGGYSFTLRPDEYSSWNTTLDTHRRNSWIDVGTRAVIIETTWYFYEPAMWAILTFVFDVNADNTVTAQNSPMFWIGNMVIDEWDTGFLQPDSQELVWVLVALAISMVFVEISDLLQIEEKQDLRDYMTLFKIFDLLNVFLIFWAYSHIMVSLSYMPDTTKYFNGTSFDYVPWNMVAQNWIDSRRIMAAASFLSILRFLKFFSLVPKIAVMADTFTNAKFDLCAFSTVFAIVVVGFAQAFHIIFSAKMSEFSSIYTSVLSSFNALLGTLDVNELTAVDPVLGPLLFTTFIFLNLFILLNIFITITNNSFTEVSDGHRRRLDTCKRGSTKSLMFHEFGLANLFKERQVKRRAKVKTAINATITANAFVRALQTHKVEGGVEEPSMSREEVLEKRVAELEEELRTERENNRAMSTFINDMQTLAARVTK